MTGVVFSNEEILALLNNHKSQFRRVVAPMRGQKWLSYSFINLVPKMTIACTHEGVVGVQMEHPSGGPGGWIKSPFGDVGDTLFVKEKLTKGIPRGDGYSTQYALTITPVHYAEGAIEGYCGYALWQWKDNYVKATNMPQWASRFLLKITKLEVERLQDITEDDLLAEGVEPCIDCDERAYLHYHDVIHCSDDDFVESWNKANKEHKWHTNPWVWKVTFKEVAK